MNDGIAQVQARIAEIRGMFPATRLPAVSATGTTSASGTAFAAALEDAQAATGTSGTFGTSRMSDTDGGSGATGAAGSVSGDAAVAAARRYLGVPYLWGGTDPSTGLDCSGLVQRAYADLGVSLPRVSRDQARAGTPVGSLAEARPGDIVAFGHPVHHVGLYVGDGQMLEAPRPGKRVRIARITETPSAIRRVVPAAGAATSARAAGAATAAGGASDVPYAGLFRAAAARHGVPAKLLAAVAKAESGFDPRAVSGAGARGLMQLMPGTARQLGVDPFDPAQAIEGSARMLAGFLRRYDGSVPLALAAYNAGPGTVHRYGGVPPYQETQTYVRRVQTYMGEVRP